MMTQAVHDRLMFAMRSLAGDLRVLSSISETMAMIISSIGFVFLFDHVRVNGVIMAKIMASDGVVGDYFGFSASMDGDYAIIGAANADSYNGSAYIFMRSGVSWNQQAKLSASDGAALDKFGFSVSISGDYALIGAPYSNSNNGSAYVFMRSSTVWNQQTNLIASDGESDDKFGFSVSIDGVDALIGSRGDSSSQGSAYVFVLSGVSWDQQAKLTASDGVSGDLFGQSASLSGDYALIGAIFADVGSNTNQGAVYVFVRSGTAWDQQAKLTATGGMAGDNFGQSVSIDGDYALVGADGSDSDTGSANIFMRSSNVWNQQANLTASDGAVEDYFGIFVSLSGDYALIGASYDTIDGNIAQGSAYVFQRSGSDWDQYMKLNTSNGEPEDLFGVAVALDGLYAVVGAIGDDSNTGAAYTYQLDDTADEDDGDGSMMIGGVSILGLSLISLLMMW